MLLLAPLLLALAPGAPAAGTSPALEAALESVDAAGLCADVRFLASDELAGRDTPSHGLAVAARYLAARLERLGIEPARGGSHLQPWTVRHLAVDPERTRIELTDDDGNVRVLRFGEDYLFTAWELADAEAVGELVYCGSGTRADFAAAEVTGRFAVCVDAAVHERARRDRARRAGALGLLVVPDPRAGRLQGRARLERAAAAVLRGRVEPDVPGRAGRPAPPRDPGARAFHQLFLNGQGLEALLALAGGALPEEPGTPLGIHAREHRRLPGDGGRVEVENVCGFLRGSDPELAREVILVSAHYDHEGVIAGEIYNGADDNASGSSALLALAEALVDYPLRRSVMLVWVAGEEKGLYGSRAFVRDPPLPDGTRPICDLNLDMVGRNEPDELYVTPSPAHRMHNGLVELVSGLAPLEGFGELGSADLYYDRSDHAVFARLGIPVAFLFNGEHADYHRPTDDFDAIDCGKIRRVARLVLRTLDALQTDDLDL